MAEDNKKGITVKVDADLHAQIKEYIESRGMTMADFITAACDGFLHPKIQEKDEKQVENMRTVAFQVPESLFQRIKDYLHRNNMTQRQFLLGLIENELEREQTQREAAVEPVSAESEEADEVTEQTAEPAVADGVPTVVGEVEEATPGIEEAADAAPAFTEENTEQPIFFGEREEETAEQQDSDWGDTPVDEAEGQIEDNTLNAVESDDHIIDAVFAPWDVQEQTEEGMEDEAEEEYQDFSMGM